MYNRGCLLVALALAAAGAVCASGGCGIDVDAVCTANGAGVLCHPCQRNAFIVCVANGTGRTSSCPRGKLWDAFLARCVPESASPVACVAGKHLRLPGQSSAPLQQQQQQKQQAQQQQQQPVVATTAAAAPPSSWVGRIAQLLFGASMQQQQLAAPASSAEQQQQQQQQLDGGAASQQRRPGGRSSLRASMVLAHGSSGGSADTLALTAPARRRSAALLYMPPGARAATSLRHEAMNLAAEANVVEAMAAEEFRAAAALLSHTNSASNGGGGGTKEAEKALETAQGMVRDAETAQVAAAEMKHVAQELMAQATTLSGLVGRGGQPTPITGSISAAAGGSKAAPVPEPDYYTEYEEDVSWDRFDAYGTIDEFDHDDGAHQQPTRRHQARAAATKPSATPNSMGANGGGNSKSLAAEFADELVDAYIDEYEAKAGLLRAAQHPDHHLDDHDLLHDTYSTSIGVASAMQQRLLQLATSAATSSALAANSSGSDRSSGASGVDVKLEALPLELALEREGQLLQLATFVDHTSAAVGSDASRAALKALNMSEQLSARLAGHSLVLQIAAGLRGLLSDEEASRLYDLLSLQLANMYADILDMVDHAHFPASASAADNSTYSSVAAYFPDGLDPFAAREKAMKEAEGRGRSSSSSSTGSSGGLPNGPAEEFADAELVSQLDSALLELEAADAAAAVSGKGAVARAVSARQRWAAASRGSPAGALKLPGRAGASERPLHEAHGEHLLPNHQRLSWQVMNAGNAHVAARASAIAASHHHLRRRNH